MLGGCWSVEVEPITTEEMNKRPYMWYCPVCKKYDLAGVKENLASPEHIPYRGVDIGSCKEEMIPLYKHEQIEHTGIEVNV